jgi:hypothetical protein
MKKVINQQVAPFTEGCFLVVDMTNFEAKDEAKLLMRSGEFLVALNDIYNLVRGQLKHGEYSKEKYEEILTEIRQLSSISLD